MQTVVVRVLDSHQTMKQKYDFLRRSGDFARSLYEPFSYLLLLVELISKCFKRLKHAYCCAVRVQDLRVGNTRRLFP